MRVLVISDIHSNLTALEAVLDDATQRGGYDGVWCLGDLVGYGPKPNECVARVRDLPNLTCLVGNHDKAVLDETSLAVFNTDARLALVWTRSVLSPETLNFLQGRPEIADWEAFTLAHGSPRQPVWEYILDRSIAQEVFPFFKTRYCLVGHTHVPVVYRALDEAECVNEPADYSAPLALGQNGARLIINPGSVGQPRDNEIGAAYALLDTATAEWEFCRVHYDVAQTQEQMRAVGLPPRLIARLAFGW